MGLLDDKSETIRRLTKELVEVREANGRLQEELRAATGGRQAAVQRIRDLEDILRLKERLATDTDRQLSSAHTHSSFLSSQLSALESQLSSIRAEQTLHPLSDLDLLHRHSKQSTLFESVREALTCPICYEFFGRGERSAVSLLCGHSFCEPCFGTWEAKHLETFKASRAEGAYYGADCPECRSTDVRRGRVRIWAMEEVVRLVERGAKEAEVLYVPPRAASPPSGSVPVPETAPVEGTPEEVAPGEEIVPEEVAREEELVRTLERGMRDVEMREEDEPGVFNDDAARLMRPRTPLPYGRLAE